MVLVAIWIGPIVTTVGRIVCMYKDVKQVPKQTQV